MPDERRLNDEEVAAVLRRASEESAETGLTVSQVKEIAADVGIEPAAVQRALALAATGALMPAAVDRRFGVPVGVNKDVLLPGGLSDAAWAVLVSRMRATFAAQGKESYDGVVRAWRNGNLRIALEPTPDGHRLRMSTLRTSAMVGPMIGSIGAMMSAATVAAGTAARPALMLVAAIPAALGAALLASPFVILPQWARARSEQFDAIAREAASLATSPQAPALPRGDRGETG